MKANVLFLHPGGELYGADRNILRAVIALRDAGYQCFMILGMDGPLRKKAENAGIAPIVFPLGVLRKAELRKPKGIFIFIMRMVRSILYLSKFIQDKRVSYIHSNTVTVLPGCFFYGKKGIKHIWHVRETIKKPLLMKWFFYFIVRNRSDLILCVSEAAKNAISSVCGKRNIPIRVLNNGIDAIIDNPLFSMQWKSNVFRVGMVGRFNAGKGQLSLAKSIKAIVAKDQSLCVKFIFIGGVFNGNMYWKDKFIRYIQEEKIERFIEIYDFAENLKDYYAGFDLCVLPSTTPDSFPTVVLEAISAGVPVVGYNNGGIYEMLADDRDCLVEINDYYGLSRLILKMMNDHAYRFEKAKSQHSRFTQEYTVDVFRRNLINIYAELEQQKRSGRNV